MVKADVGGLGTQTLQLEIHYFNLLPDSSGLLPCILYY